MSRRDLIDKWLFLGFSDKRQDEGIPKSRKGRLRKKGIAFAGAKGIGRFSCDTLGAVLDLHTKVAHEKDIHELAVDWKKFEKDQSKQFQKMKAVYSKETNTSIEEFDLAEMGHGTILEIGQLRNRWGTDELRALKKYLQRLINPSVDGSASASFTISVKAEEFVEDDAEAKANPEQGLIVINGPVENFVFEKLGIKTTFIHSRIHDNRIVTRLMDKERLVFEMKERNTYAELRDVEAKIFFLNTAAKQSFTRTMGVVPKKYGSVLLYKNEFRIHPYGDEGDDWLQLEERKGQGYKRYLSKRDIIGAVIVRGSDPMFKEASSRDAGLIRNEAFWNLYDYVFNKVFRRLERYVEGVISFDRAAIEGSEQHEDKEARTLDLASKLVEGTKGPETTISVGPGLLQILDEGFVSKYPKILGNLISIRKHLRGQNELKELDAAIKSVKKTLAETELDKSKMASALAAQQQETMFLKRTLTPEQEKLLGHVHSIKVSAQEIQKKLGDLRKWTSGGSVPSSTIDTIDDCYIAIRKIINLSTWATTARFDLEEDQIEADVVSFVRQYLGHYGRSGKDVLMPIQIYNDRAVFVRKIGATDLSLVFDNLLDNSRKNGASIVSVKFEIVDKTLHIYFGDDGRGIDSETADHIFEMGFTTTPDGSGLGLYECKKLMRRLGGEISFIGNNKHGVGSGACFELVIP
jgi:signal transduction histidine kinase